MPRPVAVLIVTAVLGAVSAVYGGVTGSEGILAAGLVAAFLSILFIPVLLTRANKRRRLFSRQDALLVLEYSESDTGRIAAHEAKKVRKTSVRLSILTAVCLAIIFTPFVVIVEAPARFLILYIGIIVMLLPFVSVYFAPVYTASVIQRIPSYTIIGRDYILVNNRYIGINDRADLKLKSGSVGPGADGTDALFLVYTFRMKYSNPTSFPVEVPLPRNRIDDAKRFAESIKSAKNK